jgi:hypothetical protein
MRSLSPFRHNGHLFERGIESRGHFFVESQRGMTIDEVQKLARKAALVSDWKTEPA